MSSDDLSATREATRVRSERVVPPDGERYGVVIGIDAYADERLNLRCAGADARAVHRVMIDPDCGCFPEDHVELLLDAQATKEAIWKALARLRKRAGENDTIWIYYAGHAAIHDGDAYWVAQDTDVDDLFATGLGHEQIASVLEKLSARCVLLILDCCHAAATAVQKTRTRSVMSTQEIFGRFEGRGAITIAASDGKQRSIELSDLGHGAFTYFLEKGLRGEADVDGDGVVTADELWDYLHGKVKEASSRAGNSQTPVLIGELSHDIALTLNPAAAERARQMSSQLEGLVGRAADQLTTDEARVCQEILRRGAGTEWERSILEALEAVAQGKIKPTLLRSLLRAGTPSADTPPAPAAPAVAPAPRPAAPEEPNRTPRILFLGASSSFAPALKELSAIEWALGHAFNSTKRQILLIPQLDAHGDHLQAYSSDAAADLLHVSAPTTPQGDLLLSGAGPKPIAVTAGDLAAAVTAAVRPLRCVVLRSGPGDAARRTAAALQRSVGCVVALSSSIGDKAAEAFCTAFYWALALGRSVAAAFEEGLAEVALAQGSAGAPAPELFAGTEDPAAIFLVDPSSPSQAKASTPDTGLPGPAS